MINSGLPILLGCYDNADKCIAYGKSNKFNSYSMVICRLKKRQETGTTVDAENIDRVIADIHLCTIDAARVFRDIVVELVEKWEGENNAKVD